MISMPVSLMRNEKKKQLRLKVLSEWFDAILWYETLLKKHIGTSVTCLNKGIIICLSQFPTTCPHSATH